MVQPVPPKDASAPTGKKGRIAGTPEPEGISLFER
jgi:hypothetical protein